MLGVLLAVTPETPDEAAGEAVISMQERVIDFVTGHTLVGVIAVALAVFWVSFLVWSVATIRGALR